MPKYGFTALTAASLLAILVAAQKAEELPPEAANKGTARSVASMRAAQPSDRHTEKLRGPLRATVELIGSAPQKSGDVFILQGTVSSSEDLSNISFSWGLPEDVELINGVSGGVLTNVSADQPSSFVITLKANRAGVPRVNLLVRGEQGGARFANAAHFDAKNLEGSAPAGDQALNKAMRASSVPEAKEPPKPRFKVME